MTDRYERIRAALAKGNSMIIEQEQERTEFEAWAANIGFSVTGKYAETLDVLCAESAFKAGYKAGRAAMAAQDTALLRQALDTLAYWLEHGETPGAHDMIQRTHDALQERLK